MSLSLRPLFIPLLVSFLLFLCAIIVSFSLFHIGNAEVVDILKDKQKPKKDSLRFKVVSCTISSLLKHFLLFGMLAVVEQFLYSRVLPIVFFVLIGTYFLFSQSIVALCSRLYRKKKKLYGGTNLITQTNLIFNIKDYSRLFFLTSDHYSRDFDSCRNTFHVQCRFKKARDG